MITGASRGLGHATAHAFAEAGANLILSCRSHPERLTDLQQQYPQQNITIHAADLSSREETMRLGEAVRELCGAGGLDACVLAGGTTLNRLIARTTDEEFDELVRVNLTSCALLLRELSPVLTARKGHAVLIGSHPGLCGKTGLAAYGAAKAGLVGLMRSVARELAPDVRVNLVLPGYMLTDMGLAAGAAAIETARNENLLHELSDPEEVAAFLVHLADLRGVSGQLFNLDSRQLPF